MLIRLLNRLIFGLLLLNIYFIHQHVQNVNTCNLVSRTFEIQTNEIRQHLLSMESVANRKRSIPVDSLYTSIHPSFVIKDYVRTFFYGKLLSLDRAQQRRSMLMSQQGCGITPFKLFRDYQSNEIVFGYKNYVSNLIEDRELVINGQAYDYDYSGKYVVPASDTFSIQWTTYKYDQCKAAIDTTVYIREIMR